MENNSQQDNFNDLSACEKGMTIINLQKKIENQKERLRITQSMARIGDWRYNLLTNQLTFSEEVLKILGCHNNVIKLVMDYNEFEMHSNLEIKRLLSGIYDKLITKGHRSFDKTYDISIENNQKTVHIIANIDIDDHKNIKTIIGTIQDVTERVQLEEALRQAEKLTAIGQLAGGIAHDFNNILMAISGYAELIQFKVDDIIIKKYCEKIIKSIDKSADLTNKLLAFSRKDSAFKKQIHIHDSVIALIDLLARTITKSIIIECKLMAKKDCIFGDASEIENVFMNLCINARDALDIGGVIRVISHNIYIDDDNDITNEFEINSGEYICFSVIDNGCGIDPQHIKKIFDPFFTTKTIGKGTGLGLSAIYGTVVTHGGAITVESEVGVGTTFKLYYPLIDEEI